MVEHRGRTFSGVDVSVTPEGAFAAAAAAWLTGRLQALVDEGEGEVTVALAGGGTPRAVYALVASAQLPWRRFQIFFGDERAVPPDDPRSNYRMARESLLDRVPIPPERVHAMDGAATSLAAAAAAYASVLPDSLDLLLLGIGADGHTASLFPGAATLTEERRKVLPAHSPDPPRDRLTVTPAVLRQARNLVVLAAGDTKAPVVARALVGAWNPSACPAQLARHGSWILDPAAASGLVGIEKTVLAPPPPGAR